VLCPPLCRTVLASAGKVSLYFVPFHDGTFEAVEKGRLDLLLVADDGTAPPHFANEIIFEVDFVCVVAKESNFSRALTLKQYLAANHIGISILGGIQTIPEKRLAAIGVKRRCPVWVPYHTAALRSLAGTNLIATVPRRMTELEASNPAIKILKAPAALGTFKYLGLASTNDFGRGSRLVALDHPPSRKNNIDRVRNAYSAPRNISQKSSSPGLLKTPRD
jgi:hypothetical protein